nr:hypothetical protein [uncultured Rhodopila sp.]
MPIAHALRSLFAGNLEKIRDINRKYATPRITMSLPVRLALLALRVYLLVLVGLLAYKFIVTLSR